MFGKKKIRVISSLFEMYKIAHEALSSAHMEDVYTVEEYTRMREAYSDTMLSVARAVSGEEGVFRLSSLCEQFHSKNVEILNKECEEMEERALRESEKEESACMEEKYDGYVTTMTKSPIFSDRWKPAIGEAGWHAREGEMGSRGQERTCEAVIEGGHLFGDNVWRHYMGMKHDEENPAVKYIYRIILIRPKDSSIDVSNERDKLINVLRNKGFEVELVYANEFFVYSEKLAAEFEEMFEPVYASTGIKCRYEVRHEGEVEPAVVVRYGKEDWE